MVIRAATTSDAPQLQDVERLASQQFREVGLPQVADDDPGSTDELSSYALDERSWVALDDNGAIVGYVLVDVVDGNAHVEQVSVLPDHQGLGVGRALLERVQIWALAQQRQAVTLTTFADVPWNAPLYTHLGFRTLDEAEIGPELRALRDAESAHGFDPSKRVCMRLDLAGGGEFGRRVSSNDV